MTTVTQKSQVTIPKDIRDPAGIRPGDEIEFELEDNHVVLYKKGKKLPFEKWRGYLGRFRTDKALEELR
ncbi:MAG TPA: AbrB/MazE/SpoVT family DNA-binding domain-containing protein [Candidatus Nanoarchaeia archaeon]|nr:AbrB/MazE/SpoVT family DNA-binding domain-containing protein [Candidatus Nanoarchaeia archaeon]